MINLEGWIIMEDNCYVVNSHWAVFTQTKAWSLITRIDQYNTIPDS